MPVRRSLVLAPILALCATTAPGLQDLAAAATTISLDQRYEISATLDVGSGRLDAIGGVETPDGIPGLLVIGEVVQVRDALSAASAVTGADATDEVKYGRNG